MNLSPQDQQHFWAKVDRSRGPKACWEWISPSVVDGYGAFWVPSEGRKVPSHRVAYAIEHGGVPRAPGPHGGVVRHTCDNRLCCNPRHLIPGTQGDNVADTVARDRHARGERQPGATLSDDDVEAIRAEYGRNPGVTQAELARRYGVTQGTISKVVNHRRWSHVGTVAVVTKRDA